MCSTPALSSSGSGKALRGCWLQELETILPALRVFCPCLVVQCTDYLPRMKLPIATTEFHFGSRSTNHQMPALGHSLPPCPGSASCSSCYADLLSEATPSPHINFYSPVTLQSFLFFLSLPPPIFLSSSNFLGLDIAPHQQILVDHIFLLPIQLLFLYYYVCIIFVICLKWRK